MKKLFNLDFGKLVSDYLKITRSKQIIKEYDRKQAKIKETY